MSEATNDLVISLLRTIQAELVGLRLDVATFGAELATMRGVLGALQRDIHLLSLRLDRDDDRLDRIERRLDRLDPDAAAGRPAEPE